LTTTPGQQTVIAILEPPACIAIIPAPGHAPVSHGIPLTFTMTQSIAEVECPSVQRRRVPRRFGHEIDVVTRDPDGWVWKVEFFANAEKIGEQQIHFIIPPPPGQVQFSMVWSSVPGANELMASDGR
jgi:hypothetical protein